MPPLSPSGATRTVPSGATCTWVPPLASNGPSRAAPQLARYLTPHCSCIPRRHHHSSPASHCHLPCGDVQMIQYCPNPCTDIQELFEVQTVGTACGGKVTTFRHFTTFSGITRYLTTSSRAMFQSVRRSAGTKRLTLLATSPARPIALGQCGVPWCNLPWRQGIIPVPVLNKPLSK